LVFQGQGSGELVAFEAQSGKKLWSTDAQSGIIAPPISYQIDGEQYLAVMAGWGGAIGLVLAQPSVKQGAPGRLLVYKIGGEATLPSEAPQGLVLDPPPDAASDFEIASGLALYNQHCMRCHGLGAVSQGLVPDLRAMSKTTHEIFDAIVLDGVLAPVGMIGFESVMTKQDSEHVRRYLIRAAHDQVALQEESSQWRGVRDWFFDQIGWLAAKVL
jgi:quinohemoprotein ethanol dehydrogenase